MSRHEKLVHDELESCPYIPGEVARMPLRWQLRRPTPEEFDASLARGDRRIGRMLYRTACPECSACEPLRIPVADFKPSRSMRRAIKKNLDLRVEIGPARFSEEKLALYNRHKQERGLARFERQMNQRGYEGWFLNSCATTLEFRYLHEDRLIGVGVVAAQRADRGEHVGAEQVEVAFRAVDAEGEPVVDPGEHLPRRDARLHQRAVEVEDDGPDRRRAHLRSGCTRRRARRDR